MRSGSAAKCIMLRDAGLGKGLRFLIIECVSLKSKQIRNKKIKITLTLKQNILLEDKKLKRLITISEKIIVSFP